MIQMMAKTKKTSGESIGEGESLYGGSHINCDDYIGTDEDFSDLSHSLQTSASRDDSDDSWIAAKRKRPNWRKKRRFIELEDTESE